MRKIILALLISALPSTNAIASGTSTHQGYGTWTGNVVGNASTATALATAPNACSASHQWAVGIAANGNASCTQPAASDLSNGVTGSGSVVLSASPAFTGDVDFGGTVNLTSGSGYISTNSRYNGSANGMILFASGTASNLGIANTASNIYTLGPSTSATATPTKVLELNISSDSVSTGSNTLDDGSGNSTIAGNLTVNGTTPLTLNNGPIHVRSSNTAVLYNSDNTANVQLSSSGTGSSNNTFRVDTNVNNAFKVDASGNAQSAGTMTATTFSGSGASLTSLNASNLSSGTVPSARMPTPTASTLGGVESLASTSHQWINTISTAGVPSSTQPAFTDISGSVASTQMPALTGDITTSAGSTATTAAATQANITTLSNSSGVAVHGTNTSSNASAGYVGEYLSSINSTGVSLTNSTIANITSKSLTAGDWDVWAVIAYISGGGVTSTIGEAAISTANNTVTGAFDGTYISTIVNLGNNNVIQSIGPTRVSLSSTTTYYLNCDMGFSAGTVSAKGGIFARRRQ